MNELDYLSTALRSPNQSGKGLIVSEYEAALASYFGIPHAIVVNSGSAAIQTALHALGARPGRRVVVSAAAPLPTLLPIAATGASITFADCRPGTPAIDPTALRGVLGSDVAAVVEVSLWGYPQDYTNIAAILDEFGVPLVEDAAQAHGARLNGQFVGTFGQIGCFSTHDKKLLSTGEGGFLLTKSSELAERMRKFSRLGNLDGNTLGMNFKLSTFAAAVGLARLRDLDSIVARRRTRAHEIFSHLASFGCKELHHCGQPNGYNLVLDLSGHDALSLHRDLSLKGLRTDMMHYGYKCGYKHGLFSQPQLTCPNAEQLIPRLIQLPTDRDDSDIVAQIVMETLTPQR